MDNITELSRKSKRNYLNDKAIAFKQTVVIKILETCTGTQMNLRTNTKVEITWSTMEL
jgi:hypothetical protein